ncbi:uncharacterized protein LOC101854632 [Aplysia californica]|uniref:Uncharacterized protein LOC101854632 n=1 Tax=Aplysia californica TaxID=6500 RepID=A0ABM0JK85_APLCA|nr:uncharacterized protein LOC101854632 [Aplysia californica]
METKKAILRFLLSLLVCVWQYGLVCSTKICSRDQSRVVARIVKEKILPAFKEHRVPLASECQFATDRDMYMVHEDNKMMENTGRWACDFCGKAFVSEYFLDAHFGNRHSEHIQSENALCLADVCDVFRCDIVSGASTPDYWDIALCMEDDMKDLFSQCEALVDECIPASVTKNQSRSIKDTVVENVCSFLTCMKFWNTPMQQEESSHMALYIVLTTMTCFGIIIYNFVFYNYFFSDLSLESTYNPPPQKSKKKQTMSPYSESREPPRPRRPPPRPRHQL